MRRTHSSVHRLSARDGKRTRIWNLSRLSGSDLLRTHTYRATEIDHPFCLVTSRFPPRSSFFFPHCPRQHPLWEHLVCFILCNPSTVANFFLNIIVFRFPVEACVKILEIMIIRFNCCSIDDWSSLPSCTAPVSIVEISRDTDGIVEPEVQYRSRIPHIYSARACSPR